ncbi:MAG TPA: hypothetical protein VHE80_06525, partial [Acidimicrobiales bacterium]|nr:hypothetical protein [Acidimicrobiales bacterium]
GRRRQVGSVLVALAMALPVVAVLTAPDLTPALDAQVDLTRVESDDALRVYENSAWVPARARLTPAAAAAIGASGVGAVQAAELAGSEPVLQSERSPTRFKGQLRDGDDVLLSESYSRRWQLRVEGDAAPRTRAFGWATAFRSPASGSATLRYRTSPVRYLAVVVEVALWVVVLRQLVLYRRRERTAG